MRNHSLFGQKQLASFLVVFSILFGAYYFANNLSKIRNTLRFHYQEKVEREARLAGKGPGTLVDVKTNGRSLVRRYFYSPFCMTHECSIYALECDLHDKRVLPSVQIEVDGRARPFDKLFLFKDFSICLDPSTRKAYAFIHREYLSTLRNLLHYREPLIGYLLSENVKPGRQIFALDEEIELQYAGKQDGDWAERIVILPLALEPRYYEFRFEYRVTLGAQPYFIVGQHPHWFVHEQLPVSVESEKYSSCRIVAAVPQRLDQPRLVLRNWGGIGTAFFRNVRVSEINPGTEPTGLSYQDDLEDLGGLPEVVTIK